MSDNVSKMKPDVMRVTPQMIIAHLSANADKITQLSVCWTQATGDIENPLQERVLLSTNTTRTYLLQQAQTLRIMADRIWLSLFSQEPL